MCSAVFCKVISVDGLKSNQLVFLQLLVVRLGRWIPRGLESRETVNFPILLGWLDLLFLGCHGVALIDARWVAGAGLEDSRTLRVETAQTRTERCGSALVPKQAWNSGNNSKGNASQQSTAKIGCVTLPS